MGSSATIFKDGAAGEAVRKITVSGLLKVTGHLGKNPELVGAPSRPCRLSTMKASAPDGPGSLDGPG